LPLPFEDLIFLVCEIWGAKNLCETTADLLKIIKAIKDQLAAVKLSTTEEITFFRN
jgi:hypothetical protein